MRAPQDFGQLWGDSPPKAGAPLAQKFSQKGNQQVILSPPLSFKQAVCVRKNSNRFRPKFVGRAEFPPNPCLPAGRPLPPRPRGDVFFRRNLRLCQFHWRATLFIFWFPHYKQIFKTSQIKIELPCSIVPNSSIRRLIVSSKADNIHCLKIFF